MGRSKGFMLTGERQHPFYRPRWRRLLIVAAIGLWFLFEAAVSGDALWTIASGAILAFAIWFFLISWQGHEVPPTA